MSNHCSLLPGLHEVVLAASPVPTAVFAADGQCVMANEALAAYFEVSLPAVLATNFHRLPIMQTSGLLDLCLVSLREQSAQRLKFELLRRSGEPARVDCQIGPAQFDGRPYLILQFTDQSRAKAAETALRNNLAYLKSLLRTIPDLVWMKDGDGVYLFCNAAIERLFGAAAEVIVGKTDFDLVSKETAEAFRATDIKALAARGPVTFEETLVFSDGGYVGRFETIKTLITNGSGEIVGILGIARDISERQRQEAALRELAFHDALTQLPNRRLLLDRLSHTIKGCRRNGSCGALLFIDLDQFKQLNDTLGHDAGDQLLVSVSRRLTAMVRATDTVARLGGDEYVVLLEGLAGDPQVAAVFAENIADKIAACLAQEYALGEFRYRGSASVGVSIFDGSIEDPDKIIGSADSAMYAVKAGAVRRTAWKPGSRANVDAPLIDQPTINDRSAG